MTTRQPQQPWQQTAFDFRPTTRVEYGVGMLDQLGTFARELNAKRILLVTDPGLMAAGHGARAMDLLRDAGLEVFLFQDVEENPGTRHVEAGVAFAREVGEIDLLVGLGGGSAMDCTKGINFLLSNGGKMEDYWGKGKASKPMLPSIGVPTTAGTGSEAQCFALISQEGTHRKMACGDIKARFTIVLLDPNLPVSAPKYVDAVTGMDAITHAVESFVTRTRNAFSQLFARESWRLLEANFETILKDSKNIEAWGNMQLGAHFAGAAIENSMLGAAHACANPLTARFDVTHGEAVGLMLPHVVRFNRDAAGRLYSELAVTACLTGSFDDDGSDAIATRVIELREAAGLPGVLSHYGIEARHIPDLAEDATTQWTGTFNPKPVSKADFEALYHAAL